jgi:rRNA maturation protein Nop10
MEEIKNEFSALNLDEWLHSTEKLLGDIEDATSNDLLINIVDTSKCLRALEYCLRLDRCPDCGNDRRCPSCGKTAREIAHEYLKRSR